ncbi:MAG: GNAT family N-acetyltransferase [Microcella sp.]
MTEETTADPTVPLRDRVEAPRDLAMPDGPEGIQWRPLSVDDAATLAELQERISRRDHPTWSESVDELQEELEHSWVDPARAGLLAVDADGTAVGWGLVVLPPDPESLVRVILFGGVDPAHRGRGVGRRLLAWQRDRARQLLAASPLALPAWVLGYAPDRSPEHGALLQRLGFEAVRWFTTLERDLRAAGPDDRPLPEGLRLAPFDAARSEQVRAARNAAFADHWGSQPTGREAWESTIGLPMFRAELSRVAWHGDEVAGFVIVEVNEDDWERQGARSGYIGLVGTVREHRGRGLASAMLADVLRGLRDAELELAVLDVDTDNPTGALGVYTRLGFEPTAREVAYRIAL